MSGIIFIDTRSKKPLIHSVVSRKCFYTGLCIKIKVHMTFPIRYMNNIITMVEISTYAYLRKRCKPRVEGDRGSSFLQGKIYVCGRENWRCTSRTRLINGQTIWRCTSKTRLIDGHNMKGPRNQMLPKMCSYFFWAYSVQCCGGLVGQNRGKCLD